MTYTDKSVNKMVIVVKIKIQSRNNIKYQISQRQPIRYNINNWTLFIKKTRNIFTFSRERVFIPFSVLLVFLALFDWTIITDWRVPKTWVGVSNPYHFQEIGLGYGV
jgi:hypothetical protein